MKFSLRIGPAFYYSVLSPLVNSSEMQMFDFVHPADREGVRKRIREYDRDFTNVRHNETRLIALNGKGTYTEVVACSITFLGKPAMLVAYRDISQRKQTEKMIAGK